MRMGNGQSCVKYFRHISVESTVECLDASPTRLVTGSCDGRVIYWDPSYPFEGKERGREDEEERGEKKKKKKKKNLS